MSSYTAQDGTNLLFPQISDTALVNVTPATFFDKLMESNPDAYRSLTRPVVTCIFILVGISRRLTESPQSNVRLQAQDMVKRWEASGEWKVLGSIVKSKPQPAKLPASNESNDPTFQFDSKTFTLPQMNEKLVNRGVLDNVCFSRAFAKQNLQHAISKSAISAAAGHFAVHHFPDIASKIFISFNDQLRSPKRPIALENDADRSGIQEPNLSNEIVSAPAIATSMTCNGSKPDDQTRANRITKDISSNPQNKTHVSQRLGLLPPTHLEDPAFRYSSILVSLPFSIAIETCNTHAHSIREKRSNGKVLYQIEVVAPHWPSLILTCRNIVHRDYIFRRFADCNVNDGRQAAVPLSVERAEENDASANAQWYLPIDFNDSNSAIFETIQQSFQNTGMIPGADLIKGPSDIAIKRKILVVHARSDPWLKKYAMTLKGHKKCFLYAELVGSHEECSICQEAVLEHQLLPTGRTSKPAGGFAQDIAPSSKGTSPPPQLPKNEGISRRTKPDANTTSDTNNLSDRPRAQLTEKNTDFVPWKVPAAHSASLAGVNICQFVADFAELNGREGACAATGRDLVSAFNDHIDTNFPGSPYEEKVSALRRKHKGNLSTSFHPNFPALENNRFLMQEEMSLSKLQSGTTAPVVTKPVGEGSHFKDQTATDQILRSRKRRAKKKADALDLATPGIIMSPADMELGVESQIFHDVDAASGEPESHRQVHEKSKGEGGEAPRSGGAKGASIRKRRPQTKRKTTPSLNDLVQQGTSAHEKVSRKTQKILHGQSPSDSIARNGLVSAVQGPGSSDLTEVDNFLSELGEELDAKAAREIRFSAQS